MSPIASTTAAISTAMLVLGLVGCASPTVPPDWQTNSHGALKDFSSAYLGGNSRVATMELARAKSEIASTGRPDLIARVEAVRCAVQVASLTFDNCTGFDAFAQDAGQAERAYVAFLTARWQTMNAAQISMLPGHYGTLVSAPSAAARNAALLGLEAPLSRLIAAGALLQLGQMSPQGVNFAVNTASEQGWRRPLLAWLGVQLKLAQAADDLAATAAIQRRIDLVAGDATLKDVPAKP